MLGRDKPPEQLGDYTGFLMNWFALRSRQAFAAALAELELKPPQFGVMSVIDSRPGVTQQELVEATDVDASTMVALIDHLEYKGLAERRPHSNDRRKRAVFLTPAGRRTLARAQKAAARVGEEGFAALSADERAELHRLMRKLTGLD
jgi:DNA-binding MarR family transcriptional regulator